MRQCYNLISRSRLFSRFRTKKYAFEEPKTSFCMILKNDEPGALNKCLDVFTLSGINLTRIESKPVSSLDRSKGVQIIVDFDDEESSSKVQKALSLLQNRTQKVQLFGGYEVPYFPRFRSDLDGFSKKILAGGEQLEADHPGFKDQEYVKRRQEIAQNAYNYKSTDSEIPRVKYTKQEQEVWGLMFKELKEYHNQYAVPEHNEGLRLMEKHCGFSENNIPQLQDISAFLQKHTNFYLRPVSGLLTARDFLNGLAFRTFYSTQYIRHHSVPRYTPEPDIIHEFMGHVPLFSNQEFADFSQEIGMASLGVSDEEITKLATNYWFSVEFGLVINDKKERKIYGAGILSSAGEIQHSISDKPEIREWDPQEAATVPYPITTYQPIYWYTTSFKDAQQRMKNYADSVSRNFNVTYNKKKDCMEVDRKVKAIPLK